MLDIKFADSKLAKNGSVIIGLSEDAPLGSIAKALDKSIGGAITRAMKIKKFTGKKASTVSLLAPHKGIYERVVLIGLGDSKKAVAVDFEQFGGRAIAAAMGSSEAQILIEDKAYKGDLIARIALGARLRVYKFDQYKAKKPKDNDVPPSFPKKLTIRSAVGAQARPLWNALKHIGDGMIFARGLVNEPANILTPPEFAKRAKSLEKQGVSVRILSEAQMRKEKMHALLGVGQGSAQPSQLVVMEYNGAAKSKKPVVFVGKGVCFDTGGISIKPAGGMEDMKADMGGAAAVAGVMHSLAARKACANVVGVIGLVENMPGGKAQRPGDIVRSMSGQTIEVLNTDAEGRLVLADALSYVQKHFAPALIVDLATLTGAILGALGKEYAGLFSNNDTLIENLTDVGIAEGEKLWHMPLCGAFDKMIDTPNADMKNIGGRYAGSSTAAQFLQRFIEDDIAWAHLDIAGTAMDAPKSEIQKGWASGFGVKLLDRFVHTYYED